ncbi:MAG: hypothetical protein CVT98_07680, partial [Bacteroidetes bacterium HGW-Bacteroidetes-15]
MSACSEYPGYDKADNGLYYKINYHNEESPMPKIGDYVTIDMLYKTKDTTLFDSKQSSQPIVLQVNEPAFEGD